MAYSIEFKPSALRELRGLPRPAQVRVGGKIDGLAAEPRPHGGRKLEGEGAYYRIRAGDYRVIYAIEDSRRVVWIIKIGHRGDVYRR